MVRQLSAAIYYRPRQIDPWGGEAPVMWPVWAVDRSNMLSFPSEFPFVKSAADAGRGPSEAAAPAARSNEPEVVVSKATSSEPIQLAHRPTPVGKSAPTEAEAASQRQEERRKVRRDAITAAALVRVDEFHGPPAKVSLVDISIAGARFRTARQMQVGDKAQIRLEVGPIRWTTRLRVVHCTRDADGLNVVGCAFLRTELLKPWPLTAA